MAWGGLFPPRNSGAEPSRAFPLEAFQGLLVDGELLGKKFQGDLTTQSQFSSAP